MGKRLNMVLPDETVRTLNRLVQRGRRSHFTNQAVEHFVATRSAEALRAQLEAAAERDRDLDREVAADWFAVDHEIWRQLDEPRRPLRRSRFAAKSTSRRSTRA